VTALVVRRVTVGIGFQTLQLTHTLAMLMAIPTLTVLADYAGTAMRSRAMRMSATASLLALLTFVAHRAAEAVLHDQPHRAYAISGSEQRAYAWIARHTADDAIIAAHPDHVVNTSGETIARTNVLTAWTNRRVYVQRAGVDQRALVEERARQIRALFDARNGADVCRTSAALGLDYVIEHTDTRLAISAAECLTPAFSEGATRVWTVQQQQRPVGGPSPPPAM
jgi:hypothetical protein